MKRIWVSLAAAVVVTVAAIAPAAAQDTISIDLREIDGSGQSGTADITSDGDQVIVSIEIDAGPDGEPQPVHIHEGNCEDLGDVAFPLEDIVDGVSESTADVSMTDILANDYAINVHLSEDEMDVYVACGTTPLIPTAGQVDDEEDEAAEEDDEVTEEDDDAVVDDEDDAVAEDDDAVVDDEDDAIADDDEDVVEEEDDAIVEDDEVDDAEDLVPATGGVGSGPESALVLMTLLSGAALGGGLLVRRRFSQA